MKTAFVLFTLLIITAAAFAEDEQVGRYQLLSGVFEIYAKGAGSVQEHAVFRIDTKTGRTSKYLTGFTKDGKFLDNWSDISEIGEKVH